MPYQKALLLTETQGPFTLTESWPIPKPGPGELLIKVKAVALNPVDWRIQKMGIFSDMYPAVLGYDVSGDVEELGEGVEGTAKGDRIIAVGFVPSGYGGFQQYSLISADLAAKIPPSLDSADAASIPFGYATAAVGLLAALPAGAGLNPTLDPDVDYSGQPAFVYGGSTSVGQFAIQILRILKYSPIITYASAKHANYLKSLGATHVIDRGAVPTAADVPATVQKLAGGAPIKIVYDAISDPETQEASFSILAPGGIAVAVQSGCERDVGGKKLIYILGSPHRHREFGVPLWKTLAKQMEEGAIVPNRIEKLPGGLAGIADGLKRLENNAVSGVKLVALPQETS